MNIRSLSLCTRVTLDMHALNNEGTEGNQQQTRIVTVFDAAGNKASVNAVSGDMFKHILVEYLTPLLADAGEPISAPALQGNPDRVNADDAFIKFAEDKKNRESTILDRILTTCAVTDTAGTLVTRGRSVGRKSIVEFGWVVGVPGSVTTEQYFHVKYAPEGREKATGGDTVAGTQAIFHRPASSGVYALVCNLELERIGMNDITRKYAVKAQSRKARGQAVITALMSSMLAPKGAQRNTQNPHVVGASGVIAISTSTLPAPTVSPLNPEYEKTMEEIGRTLATIRRDSVEVTRFADIAHGASVLADYAAKYEPAEE